MLSILTTSMTLQRITSTLWGGAEGSLLAQWVKPLLVLQTMHGMVMSSIHTDSGIDYNGDGILDNYRFKTENYLVSYFGHCKLEP